MHPRLDYTKAAPDAFQAVYALERYVSEQSGIEPRLIHLLKLRASQINHCAYCVDLHTKEARRDGLSEQWIALVCVWRESPLFDARERALLAWVEAVTLVADEAVPDEIFDGMRAHFTDEEITKLTVAIGTINIWNRLSVGFQVTHPIDQA
ncbi:carboxymuconolactone decarboxylase family protein [uncultured Litoreibacter sp.]|uniref:carboxymuconolactone decarboxylase family protein n=1 Tax=uncultured Litoreibacter sp. TaxID=1392394 RepID=UPI0026357A0A|nr:carboxymuconolactone decarboxylase family protein [uncultured Litoreibacter sp.]